MLLLKQCFAVHLRGELTVFQPLWSPKSLETCIQLNSRFQDVYLHQRWRENVNIAVEGFNFWKCWNFILIKNKKKQGTEGKKWRSRENGRAVLTAVAGSWTHAVIQTIHTFYYPCIYRTWMCEGTHKHSHTHTYSWCHCGFWLIDYHFTVCI